MPDLGHIYILSPNRWQPNEGIHTDQDQCNVFLEIHMPDFGNIYISNILPGQLVQNVPDLGHIYILQTDQEQCNVFSTHKSARFR